MLSMLLCLFAVQEMSPHIYDTMIAQLLGLVKIILYIVPVVQVVV